VVAVLVVVLRVVLDRVLALMVVAELPTLDILPKGIERFSLQNKDFLKDFIEENKEFCSTGVTYRRLTNILNIGYSENCVLKQEFSEFVSQSIQPVLDEYFDYFGLNGLVAETDWLMLEYKLGHYFNVHTDADHSFKRIVSVVIFGNDDYEGGELEFDKMGVVVAPKFGDMLVFPSSYAFSHKVSPVSKGTKYSFVNWFKYKEI
jgi:hypothetical protein